MVAENQILKENEILERVNAQLSYATVDIRLERPRRISIRAKTETLVNVARFLKDELNFNHLASVTGVDYLEKKEFEVIYHVTSASSKILIALRLSIPRERPKAPSLVAVWESAELHERETHEMLGIDFEKHPDQSKLLLDEDWDGPPPLRRDFALPNDIN